MAILDLSKLHMYDFHYEYIKPKYGEKAKLLFTDTDSLTYHIETPDLYKDMKENEHLFDTSNYDKKHFLYSGVNGKVIGKFKDETAGVPITEFVGLRSKMYSIVIAGGKEKGTAKGIKKSYYKNHITHEHYLKCINGVELDDIRQSASFQLFRSKAHAINTYTVNKYSLTNFDDKRYILDDGISTLAYGHYKIAEIKKQ